MSSNLHPTNGGRVCVPVRFISATHLLKRQFLKSLFVAIIAFGGIGMNVWGQTTVTYTLQTAQFPTTFLDGNAGFFNAGSDLGFYAKQTGNKQAAAWRTFKTVGNGTDNTTNNRPLQVGDVFKITVSCTRAFGQIGFSLNAGGTLGASYSNRISGSRLFVNTDNYGQWYVNRSGGTTVLGAGYSPIQSTYKDYIFTVRVTSNTTADVFLTVDGIDYRAYNLTMNGSGNIDAFSVYGSDMWDGDSNDDAFWKQTCTVENTGRVELGYFLNSGIYSPGVISDGLAANSTTTTSINDIFIGGGAGSIVSLEQANTYTGTTTVNNNATLRLGNTAALGTSSATTVSSGGTLNLNGITLSTERPLTINGTGLSSAGALINNSVTASTYSGSVALGSNSRIGGTGNTTISGIVSGSFKLIKTGSGSLTLSNNSNSYSGGTDILSGNLFISNASQLGPGVVTIGSGSTSGELDITSSLSLATINVTDGSSAGAIDVADNHTVTVSNINNTSGSSNVTKFGKSGPGTLTLSGSGSYTGQIQIGGGRVIVSNNSGLGSNFSTANRGVDLGLNVGDVSQANNVSLLLTNDITLPQSIYIAPNTSSATRTIGLSGAGAATFNNEIFLGGNMTIDGGAGAVTVSGNVINTGGIIVSGGTVVLSGNNNYTGSTTISAGTLQIGSGSTTGTLGTGNVINNAAISFNRSNDLTVSNTISGAGSLTKNGAGTLTLSGANTYTGATTVSAGTLRISTSQTLKDLSIASGGTLTVDPGVVLTLTGNLTNNGTISGAGKIVMGGSSAQTISGTGTITNLEINKTVEGVTISSGVGNMQSITGVLTPTAGTLTTNGNLTLKSSADATASVAPKGASGTISGDVIVERYFGSNKRAWRLVTAPVATGTGTGSVNKIYDSWQSTATGGSNAANGTTGVLIWGPQPTPPVDNGLQNGPNSSMRGWTNSGSTPGFLNVTNTKTTELFSANTENPKSFFLFVTSPFSETNISSSFAPVRVSAKGELRQGTQTITIDNPVANQFYLIGNPYASPVNHGNSGTINDPNYNVIMNNTTNQIWMWDPNLYGRFGVGGYVSFDRSDNDYNVDYNCTVPGCNNTSGFVGGVNYTPLQSGQAFFVQAASTASSLTVTFTESSKSSDYKESVFRQLNRDAVQKLRATLQRDFNSNFISTDGAVAYFYQEGAKEVNKMDGIKMMNAANNLMFRRNGTNLTFEHRPTIQEDDTLFLDLRATSAGTYRLLLKGSEFDNDPSIEAFLQDAHLAREQALQLDTITSYEFMVDANAASSGERFRIVFRKKAMPPPVEIGTDFSTYPNPIRSGENLSVKFRNREAGKYTVAVYNLLGVQVQQKVLLHGGGSSVHNIALQAGLPAGTYLLQILDGSSKKIDALKINVQ